MPLAAGGNPPNRLQVRPNAPIRLGFKARYCGVGASGPPPDRMALRPAGRAAPAGPQPGKLRNRSPSPWGTGLSPVPVVAAGQAAVGFRLSSGTARRRRSWPARPAVADRVRFFPWLAAVRPQSPRVQVAPLESRWRAAYAAFGSNGVYGRSNASATALLVILPWTMFTPSARPGSLAAARSQPSLASFMR